MALTLEEQDFVWQRVKIALANASPHVQLSFKNLRSTLVAKGKIKLQFVALSDITGDTIVADVACKFYGAYVKKQATATDAFFKMNDNATTCGAANGGSATDSYPLYDIGDEAIVVYHKGRAQANGITVASQTNLAGNTDSTSGDGPNGFIILGGA